MTHELAGKAPLHVGTHGSRASSQRMQEMRLLDFSLHPFETLDFPNADTSTDDSTIQAGLPTGVMAHSAKKSAKPMTRSDDRNT
jgi:hypothetical protein